MTSLRPHVRSILDNFNLLPGRGRFKKLGQTIDPRGFVLFVGNPTSGTTLVRSLLDAHPAITISQELNLVGSFVRSERSWDYLCGAMLDNASRFADDPVWNDYQYDVPFPQPEGASELAIIGDKKARMSAVYFAENPELIDQISAWAPIPVRYIHCVRHPLDVIATKAKKNGRDVETNIARHFRMEDAALEVRKRMPEDGYHRLHLEDVIANPEKSLSSILEFLGVDVIPEYIHACAERIFDKPRRSRDIVNWSGSQLDAVNEALSEREHLHRYAQS